MQLRRTISIAAITLSMTSAALIAVATGAAGQGADATIDLTVRYPNGGLVNDRGVCATYFFADDNGLTGFFASSIGATASVPATSGARIGVLVGGDCNTVTNGVETTTWHNSQPATNGTGSTWDQLIDMNLITVQPGSNAVDVTVGAVRISGSVSGTSPAAPSSCRVTVVGTSAISDHLGPFSTGVESDGTWEIWVHPGTYTAETSCFLRSAFEAWPNQARVGDATPITLAHGQQRTGINFDLSDRFNESTGTNVFFEFDSNDDFDTPKCIEAYASDGTLVRRQFSSSVAIADNGQYRFAIVDCFGLGFDDQWFPAGATRLQGPQLTVDGSVVEQSLPTNPLFGIDYYECNGLEVTLHGTAGDDILTGTPGPDVISGLSGNDTITALGGDDTVCGGAGNDRIAGNAGDDWVDAGEGDDWIGGGWGDDIIFGGGGNDFIRSFKHDDTVDGGNGNDIIRGGWGNDVLRGGAGNDIIRAYYGADRLFGDAGNDVLLGSYGPDFIVGGPGAADRIFGEQGTQDECNDVGAQTQFTGCERINGN